MPPRTRLDPAAHARVAALLDPVDAALARDYPGPRAAVQPVHTVYVPADAAEVGLCARWGEQASALADAHAEHLAGLDPLGVLPRVRERLARAPVADLRLDLEDGYGWRTDAAEDADAHRAGQVLAALAGTPGAPDGCGVRPKGLEPHERARALRTLDLVLDGAGGVPAGFVVTVPKLRAAGQVDALVALCGELERAHGLPERALRVELQVETPQAVLGADGGATLARALHRSDGRCTALHYGTYDYSAALGVGPAQQALDHPVADHAKAVMAVAAAGTGVWVCDGSTNVVPVGDDAAVAAALDLHHRLVTRALERGYPQGWDLHPGHLVTRWLATTTHYRRALAPAAARLRGYLERRSAGVLDEPATAQALAAVLLRGLECGALDEAEVQAAVGAGRDVLAGLLTRAVLPGPAVSG